MNRIPRRSAAEEAEALLEVGRTQPALHYDVELGLARHHHWLRSEAPLPEWASAGVGVPAKSLVPVVIKTLVSAVLVGALAVAGWQTLGARPQPSAAVAKQSSPSAEGTPAAVAPSGRDATAQEAWLATTPIPVSNHALPNDEPVQRTVRADASEKRTPRVRSHKEPASARAASARTSVPADDATPARVEPTAPSSAEPSEDANVQRANGHEVADARERNERKPNSAAQKARPAPEPEEQAPDDLIEMQQVARAELLLERSPERALALVRQGDQRFAHGYFQQERAYITIMALIRLGHVDEARARAASFAKQFPALPYGARIRSALAARDAAR